jgi:hypothetical protein
MKQHPEQLHRRMSWSTVWNVVGEFAIKRMAAQVACQWLSVSRAQLYRLRERWFRLRDEKQPQKDWLYQRPLTGESRLPPEVRDFLKDECQYLKGQSKLFHGHFNFSFLAEQCHRKFGKRYSRHTLRRWIIAQGLFDPKTDTTSKAFVRFETGGIGMLFQHDSSKHLWVPATGRNEILIATIDDHSRKLVAATLVPLDSTWHHMNVVRETIERYGCPLAYYCDNYGVFRPDKEPYTQFGRSLKSIGIDIKFTGVREAQAKGKIEKKFDYLQRRIPYLCERYGIKNLTQANKIVVPEVVDYYNQLHRHHETGEIPDHRWEKALKEGRSYLCPLPKKVSLDFHFALHYERTLKSDGSFGFAGERFTVKNAPRRAKVLVVLRPPLGPRRPHTELSVVYKGSTLAHIVLSKRSAVTEHGESHGT